MRGSRKKALTWWFGFLIKSDSGHPQDPKHQAPRNTSHPCREGLGAMVLFVSVEQQRHAAGMAVFLGEINE